MLRSLVTSSISWLLSKGRPLLERRGAPRPAGRSPTLEGLDSAELRRRKQRNEGRLGRIKSAEAADRLALENAQIAEILRERGDLQEQE